MPPRDPSHSADRRRVVRLDDGVAQPDDDWVAREAPLEIRVAGRPLTVIMRTPGDDLELVRGFLYSERVIRAADEIVALDPVPTPERDDREARNIVAVTLREGAGDLARAERRFLASASCGVCGKTSLSQLSIDAPFIDAPLAVSPALLSRLPETLRAAQGAFTLTGGLHAAALCDAGGALLCAREDIGRHNAVDKLIGWALAGAHLPLSSALLVVSGRLGYEIVQKAIVAGVPLIAAVGAPSTLAVDLGLTHGVTLVGFLRGARMNVYSHPQRVA